MKTIPFLKDRSNTACLADGWRLFALSWREYLRFQWSCTLLAAVGWALLSFMTFRFLVEYIMPIVLALNEGVPEELVFTGMLPDGAFVGKWLVAFVCFAVGRGYWKGMLYTQMHIYRAADAFPAKGGMVMRREIRKAALRGILSDFTIWCIAAVLVAVVAVCAVGLSAWFLLLLIPIFIYVYVTVRVFELRFLLHGGSWKSALANAVCRDSKRFGGFFIVLLLASIPVVTLFAVGGFPVLVLQCAEATDALGMLKGDLLGMPPYANWLYVLAATLQGFVGYFMLGLQRWALALKPLGRESLLVKKNGSD